MPADLNAGHCAGPLERLAGGRVAVAGLGGLGSHVATALARCGVGHLLLVDFDVVELSNLGRQNYSIRHVGQPKTEALREILAGINPAVAVETVQVRLDEQNIPEVLRNNDIIVEAFDDPGNKARLVNTVLSVFPHSKIVCGSGLAGIESANRIRSRQAGPRLYICGDETTEARPGWGLMAPRVMACAGHQANLVLRLLAGEDGV